MTTPRPDRWPRSHSQSAAIRWLMVIVTALLSLVASPKLASSLTSPPSTLPNLLPTNRVPPPPPKRDQRFSGAYLGIEALSGITIRGNRRFSKGVGYLVGVRGRLATLLQVASVDLSYIHSGYKLGYQQQEIRVWRHSLGSSVYLHPLFIFLLRGNWFSTVMASSYLCVGVAFEVSSLRSDGLGVRGTHYDWSWSFGAGVDLPLDSIDDGASFWLGVAYRHNRLFFHTGIDNITNMTEHWLMINLSYRINGI